MWKHVLNPPNWLTSASIFCSVYAMSRVTGGVAGGHDLRTACMVVILGGTLDLLDGRVARLTNRDSAFGSQLDSIADVLCFGMAPAMIAWAWLLRDLGGIGVVIAFWFVACAAFRLARFHADASDWPLPGHSRGLTTTMAGGSLVTFVWIANGSLAAWFEPAHGGSYPLHGVLAVLMIALGGLMASSVPFRSFKDLRSNRRSRRLLGGLLAGALVGAMCFGPAMGWGVGATLYLAAGLVDGLVVTLSSRRPGPAPNRDDTSAVVTRG